jgi:hypothetical protein
MTAYRVWLPSKGITYYMAKQSRFYAPSPAKAATEWFADCYLGCHDYETPKEGEVLSIIVETVSTYRRWTVKVRYGDGICHLIECEKTP